MTTCLELFLVFFRIGLFTFGGGYGMIPLIQQEVTARGWMRAEALYRYIGICESTPGPIAVNMATFIGADRAGLAGSAAATFGVVLPSFGIIMLIAAVLKRFRENPWVRAAMDGIRPVVAGMITATGACAAIRCLFGDLGPVSGLSLDVRQAAVAALLCVGLYAWRKGLKKPSSPIILILASAACGVLVYGV